MSPPLAARPAILFFHGGAWVAGSLASHDRLCRRIAALTGQQLVAVDYRLAPENPFPAAVEDALDSHMMLLARADEWGIDKAQVSVMGDGAGATLASVVALHARDMCQPVPRAQILFYPVTDMSRESDSFRQSRHGPVSGTMLRWLHGQYLRTANDALDWRASPGLAATLIGLPPAFIAIAGDDPLRDEERDFAERLTGAGVAVEIWQASGVPHGFLTRSECAVSASQCLAAASAFLARSVTADLLE